MSGWCDMRTWWRVVIGALALLTAATCAPAQSDLYTDTTLLITVRKLQLTSEQMAWVAQTARSLEVERGKVAALRQSVWAEGGAHFDAVNEAWLKGEREPSRDKRAADNALAGVNQAEAKLRDAEVAATASLRERLTDDQRELVESSAHAQERRDRQARMGGMSSVGEFVAGKLDETRDLMVDEFRQVAGAEARAVAEAILGPGSRSLDQVAGNVLEMMNQARSWDNDRYARNREDLPRFVETFLRMREPDWSKYVSYDELSALVTDERTALVLGEVLSAQVVTGASASDDELGSAQRRASALNFFNSLGVTGEQATRMAQPLQNVQRDLAAGEDARGVAVGNDGAFRALISARALLVAGQEVPPETLATITGIEAALDAAQLQTLVAVDLQMQSIADIMYPAQNQRLDWTPPATVRPERSIKQRAALQRETDLRIRDAARLFERTRTLDVALFVTGRITIIKEYLDYNHDLGRPLPGNAVDICIAFTDEVRMVPVDEWDHARAYGFGKALVARLGLMPTLQTGPRPGAIGWSALYRLFTANETLQVAREMPQYRKR